MSDPVPPSFSHPVPPPTLPPLPPPAPPGRAPQGTSSVMGCFFAVSLLVNVAAVIIVIVVCGGALLVGNVSTETNTSIGVVEKFHSGSQTSKDKVAIVTLEGVIMEGLLGFVHKQIEQAAKDKTVKAVVLRINSPGGSITASEELHQRLLDLRDGKKYAPKPLVVSMGSLAASGGYYVAMPAKYLVAERTTLTGSIGVYVSLPNIHEFADKHGVKMNLFKAGEIKDSGSMFKEMSPKEGQVWQDMVNNAYNLFLEVVEKGRPELKGKLVERFPVKPLRVGPADERDKQSDKVYYRYLADGGIFTADLALEKKLIDQVGDVEDAIKQARKEAGLDDNSKVIQYEKFKTLSEQLLGVRAKNPGAWLEPAMLRNALSPRLWYLAPGHELAGLLAACEAE